MVIQNHVFIAPNAEGKGSRWMEFERISFKMPCSPFPRLVPVSRYTGPCLSGQWSVVHWPTIEIYWDWPWLTDRWSQHGWINQYQCRSSHVSFTLYIRRHSACPWPCVMVNGGVSHPNGPYRFTSFCPLDTVGPSADRGVYIVSEGRRRQLMPSAQRNETEKIVSKLFWKCFVSAKTALKRFSCFSQNHIRCPLFMQNCCLWCCQSKFIVNKHGDHMR